MSDWLQHEFKYKEILEAHGWTYVGECPICGGRAREYKFNTANAKVRKDRDKCTIRGRSVYIAHLHNLESVLMNNPGLSNKQNG